MCVRFGTHCAPGTSAGSVTKSLTAPDRTDGTFALTLRYAAARHGGCMYLVCPTHEQQ